MSDRSNIPYLDATWNPVVGCMKSTMACLNCWAARAAHRMAKNPNPKVAERYVGLTDENGDWTGLGRLLESELVVPQRWRKPRVIGVCFMGDLFIHAETYVLDVWQAMQAAPWHTYLLLTKYPLDMGSILHEYERWTDNIWAGVTVWDQESAQGIPRLLDVAAKHRWVSYEPALGLVDWDLAWLGPGRVEWVVMGCESGPGARGTLARGTWGGFGPAVSRTRRRCAQAGVPFYLKQGIVGGRVVQKPGLHEWPCLETPWV